MVAPRNQISLTKDTMITLYVHPQWGRSITHCERAATDTSAARGDDAVGEGGTSLGIAGGGRVVWGSSAAVSAATIGGAAQPAVPSRAIELSKHAALLNGGAC